MAYETVIGLEVHSELATKTKLFCGCSTAFGAEPNTQTCPVCLGMPGSLPVMNRTAFEYALRAALALGCTINRTTSFDRKNYYYPDLPKNFQISQNDACLGVDGVVQIPVEGGLKEVRIHNVHLEEDAGKNVHPEDNPTAGTQVDLNRAGTPLLEIVTQPDMRGVAEVESFMHTLRNLLRYTEVSDCKMEEGSLRFEASVSLRPEGQKQLGNRVEIKNLNSMAAVAKALRFEIDRQTEALDNGETIDQETRLWNEPDARSERMRSKEAAHDYRYFPEPDLVPIELDDAWIDRVRATVPELPAARLRRFVNDLGLSEYDAGLLTGDKALADFFEACLAELNDAKAVGNWLLNQTAAALKERALELDAMRMTPAHLTRLIALVADGTLSARNAAELLPEMVAEGADPDALVEAKGLKQISDTSDLEGIVAKAIAENPDAVADFKSGKQAALNALLGGVMRETRGQANPGVVRDLLQKKLAE